MKKFDLSGIGKKEVASIKVFPILPDPDGTVAKIVGDIIKEDADKKALEGSLKIKKADLSSRARSFFVASMAGRTDVPSSVECKNCNNSLLVIFQNKYSGLDDDTELTKIVGKKLVNQFFRQSFTIQIDGDKIPEAAVQDVITELKQLFAKHDASDALTATSTIKPVPEFHTARFTTLSVEQNQAVDQLCPSTSMVKPR